MTLIILFIFLFTSFSMMRDFGIPEKTEMDDYFIKNAQEQTGSNNVVSSIVFDYRALDTLGEAVVLFTAVMGISLIFTKNRNLSVLEKNE
ncbi:MAG: hydrogen gas-evolving membrane-bound hydrogenase subunit E [Patescibacteria group bacterium]|nr:hydrogen gas-evolving membrane-bound hydrogenase subunit E [Patescibacteria group bacterium]